MLHAPYGIMFQSNISHPEARSTGSLVSLDADESQGTTSADGYGETVLGCMLESGDWAGALSRISSHPSETQTIVETQTGRLALHKACADDAPAVVIQALLKAHPAASTLVGTTGMTPLHLTCSSAHASVHVVRVLLELGREGQCKIRDLDGDLPLHAACRSGAPLEVLKALLSAHPAAATERDFEGLTPLLRLWVRYVVTLGDDPLENIASEADLTGELGEAWRKTELLLRCAYQGKLDENAQQHSNMDVVHAAATVDCPRQVVKIAARIFPHQLATRSGCGGLTPLLVAAQAPIFKVRDLSDDGYFFEDVVHGDQSGESDDEEEPPSDTQPSVIEILLQANQGDATSAACFADPSGRLPLHLALHTGKKWDQGVRDLVQVHPEGLAHLDPTCNLFPFLLAAQGEPSDLNTVYEVLRVNPSVLSDLQEGNLNARKTDRDIPR